MYGFKMQDYFPELKLEIFSDYFGSCPRNHLVTLLLHLVELFFVEPNVLLFLLVDAGALQVEVVGRPGQNLSARNHLLRGQLPAKVRFLGDENADLRKSSFSFFFVEKLAHPRYLPWYTPKVFTLVYTQGIYPGQIRSHDPHLNDSIRRRYHNPCTYLNFFLKLPPYTLAGFNLTIHSANLLSSWQRRFH
jgi:hypothetical protein